MSAAEKLKALVEAPYPYRVPTVMAALPQIVAVVKAAEKTYDGWLAGDFDWDELVAALAALDEALSPPTGGSL